jgi:hypothetical protein
MSIASELFLERPRALKPDEIDPRTLSGGKATIGGRCPPCPLRNIRSRRSNRVLGKKKKKKKKQQSMLTRLTKEKTTLTGQRSVVERDLDRRRYGGYYHRSKRTYRKEEKAEHSGCRNTA